MDNQANKKAAHGVCGGIGKSLAEPLTQAVGSPCKIKVLDSPDLSTRQGQPGALSHHGGGRAARPVLC